MKLLTNPTDIQAWLRRYCIIRGDYTISDKGAVSVSGSVDFRVEARTEVTEFAVNFTEVTGNFACAHLVRLRSLKGAPQHVGGYFECQYCTKLKDLNGSPDWVGKGFDCHACDQLESLAGAPRHVGGWFNCRGCRELRTLVGAPTSVGGDFCCDGGALTTLAGAPLFIGKDLEYRDCYSLTTLDIRTTQVAGNVFISGTRPEFRFTGLPRVDGVLKLPDTMATPEPALVAELLTQRIAIKLNKKSKWISIVNTYHKTGDLLTAIAAFEKYFKVPFTGTIALSTSDQSELPSL